MSRLLAAYIALRHREEGQTMIEYALVLALIVLVIAAAITLTDIETAISNVFGDTADQIDAPAAP